MHEAALKSFTQLKKNLKLEPAGRKPVRAALLGDSSTQFLAQALRGTAFDAGFDLHVWEADFDQIDLQVHDPASELYASQPEIVILFLSTHKLLGKFDKTPSAEREGFSDRQLERVRSLVASIRASCGAKIVIYTLPDCDDAVFGSFALKHPPSFPYQLRKLNAGILDLAAKEPSLFPCDLAAIQHRLGRAASFQSSVYINTEMVLSLDILPAVAARTMDLIGAIHGKIRKCVVLDLDNTLWGGVIGDDGLENIQIGSLGIGKAFTEFQYWLRKLKDRGIILAVCSKNDEAVAKEPFEKHPDMVLRLDDIAVFVANWENKADNIRRIREILNIGLDSMVFLDDNPFEREMVRRNLPEVAVPELPADPADYLETLYGLNLFETVSVTAEDAERTRQYREEAQRNAYQTRFSDEGEYLASLGMVSRVESFSKFNAPRVAQLSQRSNQYNLRTVRYTEADINAIAEAGDTHGFAFTLEDKFGDNGLICAVILREEPEGTLFIDTWFMSCRVLKRGMEHLVLNTLAAFGKELGFRRLRGEYIRTAKNGMVENHYRDLGFAPSPDGWRLGLESYRERPCHIRAERVGITVTG